jgi:hypothetical protein
MEHGGIGAAGDAGALAGVSPSLSRAVFWCAAFLRLHCGGSA